MVITLQSAVETALQSQ